MRKLLLIISLVLLISLTSAKADIVTVTGYSCSYAASDDCAGVSWVTETCTTSYSNGSTNTTVRIYLGAGEGFPAFQQEPCS